MCADMFECGGDKCAGKLLVPAFEIDELLIVVVIVVGMDCCRG